MLLRSGRFMNLVYMVLPSYQLVKYCLALSLFLGLVFVFSLCFLKCQYMSSCVSNILIRQNK